MRDWPSFETPEVFLVAYAPAGLRVKGNDDNDNDDYSDGDGNHDDNDDGT